MMVAVLLMSASYAFLLVVLLYAWVNLRRSSDEPERPSVGFSIVIAARNEAEHILLLLKSLSQLNYPKDKFEVFIVDDHSDDHTFIVTNDFISKSGLNNFSVVRLKDENTGKKSAIAHGIAMSKFEWIITTDADCSVTPEWLNAYAGSIIREDPFLVSAPVVFKNEKSWFEKIQSLEFAALIGIGAALIGLRKPMLSNGANLAYRKDVFIKVNGFSGNEMIASGDDVFLLKKVEDAFPDKIIFLKNPNAIVSTHAHSSFRDFLMQRRRWVAKTRMGNWSEMMIPVFVWLFHLLLLTLGLLSFFSADLFLYFFILFFTKIIFEFPFVVSVTRFLNKKWLLIFYLPAALAYIIYVSAIPLLSVLSSFQWKGRWYNQ